MSLDMGGGAGVNFDIFAFSCFAHLQMTVASVFAVCSICDMNKVWSILPRLNVSVHANKQTCLKLLLFCFSWRFLWNVSHLNPLPVHLFLLTVQFAARSSSAFFLTFLEINMKHRDWNAVVLFTFILNIPQSPS